MTLKMSWFFFFFIYTYVPFCHCEMHNLRHYRLTLNRTKVSYLWWSKEYIIYWVIESALSDIPMTGILSYYVLDASKISHNCHFNYYSTTSIIFFYRSHL